MGVSINGKIPSGFAVNGKSVSGLAYNGKVIFKKNNGNIDISTLENLIYNSNFRYNDNGYKDYSEDTNYNSIISNPEDGWLQVKAQGAGSIISIGCTLTKDLISGHTYYARCRFDYNQPNGSYRAQLRLKKTRIEVGQTIDSGIITEQPINLSGFFTVNDETYLTIDFVQGSSSQSTTIQRKIKEPTLIDVTDLINSGISKPNIKSALDNTFIPDVTHRPYRRRIQVGDRLANKTIYCDNYLQNFIGSYIKPEHGNSIYNFITCDNNNELGFMSGLLASSRNEYGINFIKFKNSEMTIKNNIYTATVNGFAESNLFTTPSFIPSLDSGTLEVTNIDNSSPEYAFFTIEDPNIRPLLVGDKINQDTIIYTSIPYSYGVDALKDTETADHSTEPFTTTNNSITFDINKEYYTDIGDAYFINYNVSTSISNTLFEYSESFRTNLESKFKLDFSGVTFEDTIATINDYSTSLYHYFCVDTRTLVK